VSRWLIHFVCLALLALVLPGCDSGSPPPPTRNPTPPTEPPPPPTEPPPPPAEPPPPPTDPPTPPPLEVFVAADGTRFGVQTVATNLQIPWSLAFAPDGRLFVTERPGRVRIIRNGTLLADPALTLSDVRAEGEGGLLGLTLHPDFAENHLVYLVYTAQRGVNRVVRFREVNDVLGEPAVLLDNIPAANIHDGARIRFGPDRRLYVTMGDAAAPSAAQDLASLSGKILRMNDDGSRPGDNPFPSLVFTYGHRNPQGIDWHPESGELWGTEHGQTGNDEINRLLRGRNYGWPVIEGSRNRVGMEVPVLFFDPAIAPSGASFYTGTAFPTFRNNLFFATLRGQHIHRIRLDPGDPARILANERLLSGRFGRLRDIAVGPDGALYFCTSNRDGRGNPVAEDDRVLRIVPAPALGEDARDEAPAQPPP
jgi:glucose/arabinose dehydrogenase